MKRIAKIVVRRLLDPSPDVSFLESRIENGRIIKSDRYSDADIEKFGLAQVESWIEDDMRRMNAFGTTWWMIGIRADTEIQTSADGSTWLGNTVSSGGLWGIDSDSDESYLREVETDQIAELNDVLLEMGFQQTEIDSAEVIRSSGNSSGINEKYA